MADTPPFELTDAGVSVRGRLSNADAARVDSARAAHGLPPVPEGLRARPTGRGVKRQPPRVANGRGPNR